MKDILFPTVSFVVPTFNEEKNIEKCLRSIMRQDYPHDKFNILVIDGFSADKTVEIARKFPVKVFYNKERVAAAAANLALQVTDSEILAFVDADSELPQSNWLRLMVSPLIEDNSVAGSIPLLVPNKNYPAISRFFSLIQADPIIVLAYGSVRDLKGNYRTLNNFFPSGLFVLRRNLVEETGGLKSELRRSEDVDVTYRLTKLGYKFAVVREAGYYHLFTSSFQSFLRKTYNRVLSFIESSSTNSFSYMPKAANKKKFFRNLLYDASGFGAAKRVVKGIREDRDFAWIYYPIILYSTIMIYSVVVIGSHKSFRELAV